MNLDFIKNFGKAHLLVAGEVGIDEYIWGNTYRISPEAPVPVVEVRSQERKLGLGANVAQNIASLGGKVTLVSVRGNDEDGIQLETMLKQAGISNSQFIKDESRPTLRKVRVLSQRQHVVRIDYEKSHGLDAKLAKKFNEMLCDQIPSCDGIILQDYAKGLWNADTMAFVGQARAHKKPVFVDPSRLSAASLYRGVNLLTPNTAEAEILSGFPPAADRSTLGSDDKRLLAIAQKILNETEAEHVIITCGEWGMVALDQGAGALKRIPTYARDVFDVTGAGDTVISVLALTTVLGHPLTVCMQVANAAAGIVVGRVGASSVSPIELEQELGRLEKVGLLQ